MWFVNIIFKIDVVAAIKEISETTQILTKNQKMVYLIIVIINTSFFIANISLYTKCSSINGILL